MTGRSALNSALVAMKIASRLPGVSKEYDFSEAITQVEDALAAWETDNADLSERVERLEAALAEAERDIKARADAAYCRSLDKFSSTPCLGWEAKVRTGEYTAVEHEANKEANVLMGRHRGLAEALSVIRAALPPSSEPSRLTVGEE